MATLLASDADILKAIEVFCNDNNLAVTAFGRLAIGDASLVANMRAGRSLTLKTADRVRAFMANYRPESAAA